MKALLIARSNAARTAGDRRVLMVAAGFPIIVMLLVGSLFNAGRGKLTVGVAGDGSGRLGAELTAGFRSSPVLHVRHERSLTAATNDLRRGIVLLAVAIPAGYDGALRAGGNASVVVVGQAGSPSSAEARVAVTQIVDAQSSAVAAGAADRPLRAPSIGHVELVTATSGRIDLESPKVSPYSYTTPSNLVLFAFILAFVTGIRGVIDRREGVVRRILATPTRPSSVIAAELLTSVLIAAGQAVGLIVIGALVFAVHWGDPVAVALLVAALCVAAAGAGVILSTLVSTPEQVVAIGVPLGLVMGMLGGCMWPLAIVGPAMRTIGHAVPTAWAMDGFVQVIYAHAGVGAIGRDIAVLAGFAAVFSSAAVLRLRRVV